MNLNKFISIARQDHSYNTIKVLPNGSKLRIYYRIDFVPVHLKAPLVIVQRAVPKHHRTHVFSTHTNHGLGQLKANDENRIVAVFRLKGYKLTPVTQLNRAVQQDRAIQLTMDMLYKNDPDLALMRDQDLEDQLHEIRHASI